MGDILEDSNNMNNMNNTYDINIIIPNYNNSKYLVECLDSVFSQICSYKFLVIIIDDKSTDNSIDIIESYCIRYPDKITLIKNSKNCGIFAASLELYKKINSIYFTVLDSDDKWTDNYFLERALKYLKSNSDFYCYCNNTMCFVEETQTSHIYHGRRRINICGYDNVRKIIPLIFPHTSAMVFKNFFTENILKILENKVELFKNSNLVNNFLTSVYGGDSFRNYMSYSCGKSYCDFSLVSSIYRIRSNNCEWGCLGKKIQNLQNLMLQIELYSILEFNPIMQKLYASNVPTINSLKNEIGDINSGDIYKGKKISPDEFIDIFIYSVSRYNLIPVSHNYIKHYVFFFPSKIVGELEILFTNLAVCLDNIGYNVSYIDYENGHFHKLINTNNIKFIQFSDTNKLLNSNFKIEHADNVNLIIPLSISTEIEINLSAKSKIMYYMDFLQEKTKLHINKIKNNIFCKDEINQLKLEPFTNMKNKIIPAFTINKFAYPIKKIKNEINIGYLGRIDNDNIFSIINLIDNLVEYKTPLKKNIHIISDSIQLIDIDKYEKLGINIIFAGLLLDKVKYDYLHNNVDILFGFGIHTLESSSINIPSIVLMYQDEYKYTDNKFTYLFNMKNNNLGFYEKDITNMEPFICNNFADIMDDIYKYNNIIETGNKCYKYCIDKYSSNNTLFKVIEYFIA